MVSDDLVRNVRDRTKRLSDNSYGLFPGEETIAPSTQKLIEAVALGVLVAQDVQSKSK